MNLVQALIGGSGRRSLTFADLAARAGLVSRSYTGRSVTPEGALSQVTLYACVRLIAETTGILPHILYRRLERGKERATNHPVYGILHTSPNPEMTAQEYGENVSGHLGLWGNAYSEIEYDNAGRRRAVWLLRPDRMEIGINDQNERVYVYTLPSGEKKYFGRWQIWHVRGWGTDPWYGVSPVGLMRETIALAMATEEYGARFFGNDSRPGGILKTPNRLKDGSAEKLKARWEEAHNGLSMAHRVAVLEEGVEWQAIGIPPEDAQFLQTRAFQQTEICSMYRVPPHLVGITDRSTSWGTGIEQQGIGFQTFSLQPYLTRIAQSASRDLLTANERSIYFSEFLTAALVQADLVTRTQAYNAGITGGYLSPNDVREKENMNPIEGGDVYLRPLNMAPLGSDEGEGGTNGEE